MRRPEFVARQSACPSGLLGRLIGHVMARETVTANETALELLELQPADHVLEVGFGHGAMIARVAAAVSGGRVAGVDPSAEMCRMAGRRNRRAVASGKVELRRGRSRRCRTWTVPSTRSSRSTPSISGPTLPRLSARSPAC